jgi:hypothetical protein
MTVELSEDDINRIVGALDHMAAYQRGVNRGERPYMELADRLQQIKKPAVLVTEGVTAFV